MHAVTRLRTAAAGCSAVLACVLLAGCAGEEPGAAAEPRSADGSPTSAEVEDELTDDDAAVEVVEEYLQALATDDVDAAISLLTPESVAVAGGERDARAAVVDAGELAGAYLTDGLEWSTRPAASDADDEGAAASATVVSAVGEVDTEGLAEVDAAAWVVREVEGELLVDDVLPTDAAFLGAAAGPGDWIEPLVRQGTWQAVLPADAVDVTVGVGGGAPMPVTPQDGRLEVPVPPDVAGGQVVTMVWRAPDSPFWRTSAAALL